MEGRKRTVQVKFYVTEEERRLIREKMKLIPTRNMAAYLRKMAIDGYVVHIDTTDIQAQTAELQKIGVNVNPDRAAAEQHGAAVHTRRCGHQGSIGADMAVTKIHPIKSTLKRHWTTSRIRQRRMKNAGILLCLLLRNRRHRI